MDYEKKFTIDNRAPGEQRVFVSRPLGRILLRDEINVIAASFGSKAKTYNDVEYIDIVPPIPEERQAEFGKALVELAQQLDPADPPPSYWIA
jgi:hypothetical protein